jgi:hypothetical protein
MSGLMLGVLPTNYPIHINITNNGLTIARSLLYVKLFPPFLLEYLARLIWLGRGGVCYNRWNVPLNSMCKILTLG